MKASYNVTIRAVGADAIAVLLGTIDKTSYLTLVSVQEVPNGEASARIISKKPKGAVGTRGIDIAEELFGDGLIHSYESLAKLFVSKGFKAKSASPVLSVLKANGKIKQVGAGLYKKT